jgi:prepilin-type N-terminal cleavage/methylation domain-containing protein
MGLQHRAQRGFTLIELLVVVAIIAILATIGYPSYSDYVRRGKIAEAMTTLGETRAKMEQYFLDNRTYVGADAANRPCEATVLNQGKKYFTYTCSNIGAGTYTVTADGTTAANGMVGFTYTIDEKNQRASTVTGVSGWSGNATCWVLRRGGAC